MNNSFQEQPFGTGAIAKRLFSTGIITHRQWKSIEWRWKFLRLNKDYREDFEIMDSKYPSRKEWWNSEETCGYDLKWGFVNVNKIDPDLSFDDICKQYEKDYLAVEKNETLRDVYNMVVQLMDKDDQKNNQCIRDAFHVQPQERLQHLQ